MRAAGVQVPIESGNEFERELEDCDDSDEDSGHSAREVSSTRRKRARYDQSVAANGHDASAVAVVDTFTANSNGRSSPTTTTIISGPLGSEPQHFFRVGRIKEFHATWADLLAYIEYYKYATQTQIEVQDTVTIAHLNADQAQQHSSSSGGGDCSEDSELQPIPESLQLYSRTFVCAAAGTDRQDDQERCPFRFMARVVRDEEGDVWRIQVPYLSEHCVHNHPVFGGMRVARQRLVPSSSERGNSRASVSSQQQQTQQHGLVGRIASLDGLRELSPDNQDSESDIAQHQPSESNAEQGGDIPERRRSADQEGQARTFVRENQEETGESEPRLSSADMEDEEKESDGASIEPTANEAQRIGDTQHHPSSQISQSSSSPPPPPQEFLLKEYHASWKQFFGFLDDYMHASGTKLVNTEGLSVVNRNKRILSSKQGTSTSTTRNPASGDTGGVGQRPSRELVPEEWKMYNRSFMCTHGRPKRSAGQQRDAAAAETTRCQFRLVAKVVKAKDAWCIQLPHHRQANVHNHPVRTLAVFHCLPQRSADEESRPVLLNGSREEDEGHHQHGESLTQPPRPSETALFQMREYHPSWEAFSAYIGEFMAEKRTRVTIAETVKVPKRNKNLLESSQARRDDGRQVDLIPEEWQLYLRRYICVHGRPSKPGRSRGLRVRRRRVPFTGCGFRFTARVERGRDGGWCIHVPLESQFCDHNHPSTGIIPASSNDNSVGTPAVGEPQQIGSHSGAEDEDEDGGGDREGQDSDEFGGEDEVISGTEQQFRGVDKPSPTGEASDIIAPTIDSQYILTEFHDSWDDFFDYLATYMRATSSKVVIKETLSVAARNRMMLASVRAKRGGRVNLIPEALKTYTRTFICTRGWTKPSRSQGLRTRSVAPRIACPFRFTATLIMVKEDVWRIHVPLSSQLCTHNHRTMREAMERRRTSEQLQPPVTQTANSRSNLVDISAIPKDHPLYDAICDLAKQQQQQQQQVNLSSTVREVNVRSMSDETDMSRPVRVSSLEPQQHQDGEENSAEAAESEDLGEYDEIEEGDAGQDDEGAFEPPPPVDAAAIAAETTVRYDSSGEFQDVQVASVQEFHVCWESLTAYLETYMRATLTRIVIKDVLNAGIRNRQILQTKKAQQGGGTLNLIPPEFKVFSRHYICTHGWDRKQRPGNQGLRQSRVVRATGCKFQFAASVVKLGNTWVVRVPLNTQVCVHNHPVDQERFESYGSVRTVPKTHPLYDQVRQLVFTGAKRGVVYEFIHANSSFKVTRKDVDNMVRAIQKAEERQQQSSAGD